ncbi:MAG: hypothetical protein DRH34_07185 [Deltaproteobacteria bacterium]|nr:MAG: hypothetical protein DRH34_07185 [Deltaproteobacteria bacterium]
MLTIRKEQMEVFQQVSLRNFENNMIRHLQDFSPNLSKALGEDGVRDVVRLGIKQAEQYGFTNYGPVQFYIEMMFMLGSYFDTDCQLPWAARILNDPEIENQDERADCLFDKAMDYVEKVGGPNRRYAVKSLTRASQENFKSLCKLKGDLETDLLFRLKLNHPQKCQYAGDKALLKLIQQGRKLSQEYSISGSSGIICFTCFMFMLGHGFADDPLYPWCGDTLKDDSISASEKRVERLFSKGIAYLTKALANSIDEGR